MNHSGLVDLVQITNPEDIGTGLPPSTSEDAGKVLKVDNEGVPGWGEDAMATVDQTYDSTSTHAQSGVAVAQAISGAFSAGDGIAIDSGEISVDYDTNTMDIVGQTVTENVTQQSASGLFLIPSSVAALLSQQTNTQVTVHIPASTLRDSNFDLSEDPEDITYNLALYATDSTSETDVAVYSTPVVWEADGDEQYALIEEQDVVFDLPVSVLNQWSQALSSAVAFSICGHREGNPPATGAPVELYGNLSTNPITFTFVDASATKLAVKNPVPSHTSADENKVLTVNSSGNAVWAATQLPEEKSLASTNSTISITEGASTVSIDVANPLPASTAVDENKVLTVNSSGNAVWAAAQSTEYVGAPAVRVLNNVLDVKIDGSLVYGSTFTAKASTIAVYFAEYGETINVFDRVATLDSTWCNRLDAGAIKAVGNEWQFVPRPGASNPQYLAYAIVPLSNSSVPETPTSKLVFNYVGGPSDMRYGAVLSLDNLTSESNLAWSTIKANPSDYALVVMRSDSSGSTSDTVFGFTDGEQAVNADTVKFATNDSYIGVAYPLPSGDPSGEGRVLTLDDQGEPRWDIATSVMITLNAAPSTSSEKQTLFERIAYFVERGKDVFLRLNVNSGFNGSFTLHLVHAYGSLDAGTCEYYFTGVDAGRFVNPTAQYSVLQKVVVVIFDGNNYYDFVCYEIPLATANANQFNPFS